MAGIAVHVHNTTGPFKVKIIFNFTRFSSLRLASNNSENYREPFSQISAATTFVKIDTSEECERESISFLSILRDQFFYECNPI